MMSGAGYRRGVKVKQLDKYDCGAAALASVAAWYGYIVPICKVRRLCGCTREGISLSGIIDGAGKLNIKGTAFKAPDKENPELRTMPLPAIALIVQDDGASHFVAVYKIVKEKITIMDPAYGDMVSLDWSQFAGRWTGYLITFKPEEDFRPANEKSGSFRLLLRLLFKGNRILAHSIAGGVAVIVLGMFNALFLQHLVDEIIPDKRAGILIPFTLIILTLSIILAAIDYMRYLYLARNGILQESRLITGYLHKIFHLPAEEFNQFTAADLNSRIGDAFKIRRLFSEGITGIISMATTILTALIFMFSFNSALASMVLLFIPLYGLLYHTSMRVNKRMERDIAAESARFETRLMETLNGAATLRYHSAEGAYIERLRDHFAKLEKRIYGSVKTGGLFEMGYEATTALFTAIVLLAGGYYVIVGRFTVGEFISFYTLSVMVATPLNMLAGIGTLVSQAKISWERLYEIFIIRSTNPEDCPANDGIIENLHKLEEDDFGITAERPALELDRVSFSYPGRGAVFENFSLEFSPAGITAVTGGNGSGKSTLCSLLMREYQPQSGRILCYGVDISAIPLQRWLKIISIVPQRCHLLPGTLIENITLNAKEPDIGRVNEICTLLQMTEFIRGLPCGLHSSLRSDLLSGGERQKVAFARVLYRNPQIILIDEALTFVDQPTKAIICRLLKKLSDEGKRIIMVTHEREMADFADNLVELNGRVSC